jgi:UDP-3-O-[3-hydroxymyristoyl] N-acetylglucosamine deacetylase
MDAQRTLRRQISCVGIGLHSGNKVNLTLKPAPADFGIRFRRTDLGHHEVPATVQNLAGIQLATGLASNEVSVETVEHLLAALVSVGVDTVIIELNSPEVPIMDGSAAPFIYLIQEAGVKRLATARKFLKIVRPIAISRGDKRIALYPSDHFKVTYSISYDHPLLRHQSRTLRITEESFVEEIAPARTFTFLKDVEMLRQNGLALGGSLDNAIVLGETGVLNNALRFEDEFVRHKILDAVGDLALVGYPVIGHLVAHRAGCRWLLRSRASHLGSRTDHVIDSSISAGAPERAPLRPRAQPRTIKLLTVVGDPHRSNQSIPSLTRSNFRT